MNRTPSVCEVFQNQLAQKPLSEFLKVSGTHPNDKLLSVDVMHSKDVIFMEGNVMKLMLPMQRLVRFPTRLALGILTGAVPVASGVQVHASIARPLPVDAFADQVLQSFMLLTLGSTTISSVAIGPRKSEARNHKKPERPLDCIKPALMRDSVPQPTKNSDCSYMVKVIPTKRLIQFAEFPSNCNASPERGTVARANV